MLFRSDDVSQPDELAELFYVSDHNYISELCAVDFLENRVDASSASDGAGSRCVGGSVGGDGDSRRPECEAGIEEAVSCVEGENEADSNL